VSARASTLRIIEEAHRFGGSYRGGLANHLPMALIALDAMGASDERIEAYARQYAAQLEPMPPLAEAIAAGDEQRFLGSSAAFPAWVAYFAARIATEGRERVMREWSARLIPGIGSAAFHGVIRTAYALDAGSDAELAHALAYWASAYESLHQFSTPAGKRAPADILTQISRDESRAGKKLPGRSIAGRMVAASRLREFGGWIAATDPARLDLDGLAAAMVRAYAATGDFTMLHAVTGTHAARALLRLVDTPAILVGALWRALLAAYVGVGAPPVSGWKLEGDDKLEWPAILERACARDDEHDVKLAYSCWRGWQWTGDDVYRRVASAVVSRAAAPVFG
jgi:hypothetical protein